MIKMLEIEVNEIGEQIEHEYLIPIEAIEQYLETSDNEEVETFLKEEYISEDTTNIINICIKEGLAFSLVRKELVGKWKSN